MKDGTYEYVGDLTVEPFDFVFLCFQQAREVLHDVFVRVAWVLVARIAFGCHELLQPRFEVFDLLGFLGDLSVQGPDCGVFLDYGADISDLSLLNEQVLQLFHLAQKAGCRSTPILPDVGIELVKLYSLSTGESLQL